MRLLLALVCQNAAEVLIGLHVLGLLHLVGLQRLLLLRLVSKHLLLLPLVLLLELHGPLQVEVPVLERVLGLELAQVQLLLVLHEAGQQVLQRRNDVVRVIHSGGRRLGELGQCRGDSGAVRQAAGSCTDLQQVRLHAIELASLCLLLLHHLDRPLHRIDRSADVGVRRVIDLDLLVPHLLPRLDLDLQRGDALGEIRDTGIQLVDVSRQRLNLGRKLLSLLGGLLDHVRLLVDLLLAEASVLVVLLGLLCALGLQLLLQPLQQLDNLRHRRGGRGGGAGAGRRRRGRGDGRGREEGEEVQEEALQQAEQEGLLLRCRGRSAHAHALGKSGWGQLREFHSGCPRELLPRPAPIPRMTTLTLGARAGDARRLCL
mmetsp:Transcript_23212/g.66010  ORF Transcript_23212/g.66010 Transcript_23212/m.66010 type:complete len:373 (-) Transcript_23212:247-1365(-)